jgi:hypothetical protein
LFNSWSRSVVFRLLSCLTPTTATAEEEEKKESDSRETADDAAYDGSDVGPASA